MSRLSRQVILTLAYSAQFDFPLSSSEVWIRLLAPTGGWSSQDGLSYLAMIHTLWELERLGAVRRHGQYWELAGALARRDIRHRREGVALEKLRAIQPLLSLCAAMPCIWGVAVTGSAAMKNTEAEHDVDLLIVAQPQSMWLVRPVLVVYAWLAGKRRSWNHEEPDSWCFNLWLEPSELAMRMSDQTRYLGYECLQARWVLVRGSVQKDYFEANKWLAKMAPIFWKYANVQLPSRKYPLWDWMLVFRPILALLNYAAYLLQWAYMRPHQTRERVTSSLAYFHPRDTRKSVVSGWKQAVLRFREHLLQPAEIRSKPLVLVTGVFDILHQEHIRFLEKAAELGRVVVGVESDARVRQIKGEGRPINTAAARAKHIESLWFVEKAFVLPEQFSRPSDHRRLLHTIRPDILAVSSHTKHLTEKARLLQEIGGRVEIVHKHNPSISTTLILQNRLG